MIGSRQQNSVQAIETSKAVLRVEKEVPGHPKPSSPP